MRSFELNASVQNGETQFLTFGTKRAELASKREPIMI